MRVRLPACCLLLVRDDVNEAVGFKKSKKIKIQQNKIDFKTKFRKYFAKLALN
jgi:hypothetical protein